MQANTVSAGSYTFTATPFNRPFGNSFKTLLALVSPMQANEIECVVECTKDSKEPGRTYYCIYTTAGTLVSCNTLN
jgi:hypothetical protein